MTEPAPPGVTLTLLVLKTREMERVRAFFQAVGIILSEERHGQGPAHYAGRVGDTVFEIYPLPDGAGPADATTRLGFAVSDLDEVLEVLRAAGTPVIGRPNETAWGKRAMVRDPDGRAVELYQAEGKR